MNESVFVIGWILWAPASACLAVWYERWKKRPRG